MGSNKSYCLPKNREESCRVPYDPFSQSESLFGFKGTGERRFVARGHFGRSFNEILQGHKHTVLDLLLSLFFVINKLSKTDLVHAIGF